MPYLENNPKLTMGEIIEFLQNLAPEDREEMEYSGGNPEDFADNILLSDLYGIKDDEGKILALGGIAPLPEKCTYGVWLLCTTEAGNYPAFLTRSCKQALNGFEGRFLALIYTPNKRHIEFATKVMGFRETETRIDKLQIYTLEKE